MSRISRELAEQIAEKMTKDSREAVKLLLRQYEALVTETYEAQVPQAAKELLAKHPAWVCTGRFIFFEGHGFSRNNSVTATRPVIQQSESYARLSLTEKIADKLLKAKQKYDKANEAAEQLEHETVNALLSLKTIKNIREHLPAAAPFLPPPMSNALVVNFDTLLKKLERQPKVAVPA